MKLTRRKEICAQDHESVERQLDEHERRLKQMAIRLRRLEIEAGIFKPPLRRAN